MWLTAGLVFSLLWADAASACSCLSQPAPREALQASRAVFLGLVLSVQRVSRAVRGFTEEHHQVSFEVDQAWKGVNTGRVTILTSASGASCGVELKTGETYLVYAYQDRGELYTDLCTRTARAESAAEDLAVLGAGQTTTPGPALPATLLLLTGGVAGLLCWSFRKRKRTPATQAAS